MNKSIAEARDYVLKLNELVDQNKAIIDADFTIAMPFVTLGAIGSEKIAHFPLAAQDIFPENNGAYTGFISASMLTDVNVKYVIIGHSERRLYGKETDSEINRKVITAIQKGLSPIICVGETEDEYENKHTFDVIKRQVTLALRGVANEDLKNVVIAYEPIWAIGTGKSASPEIAQSIAIYIRKLARELYNPIYAEILRVIYGGSVNLKNIGIYLASNDVDGVLVGGASLQAEDFLNLLTTKIAEIL